MFQPGLKFVCDCMRFFSLPALAEIPSQVFESGLEITARAETLRVIANVFLRRLGLEAELKSQPF